MPRCLRLALLVLGFAVSALAAAAPFALAGETLVAVAANFTAPAREIGAAFERDTGHEVTFSFGSTGQLYAQVANGAPFDAFLAADRVRPAKAEADGLATPGARFTYAVGRLALWSADPDRVKGPEALGALAAEGARLAIANPRTAPYGAAAEQVIAALGLAEALRPGMVEGRSVAQTREFAASGAAAAGFVAYAQIKLDPRGSFWLVPEDMHDPIRQDAALLTRGAENPATAAFLAYLRSGPARRILARFGYGAPDAD